MAEPRDRPAERALVRVLVPLLFLASAVTAGLISWKTDDAPDVAFGNHLIFGGLLLLLLFYGALLIALPVARAIFSGELPVELTTTGPRYPEQELASSRQASKDLGERIDKLEFGLSELQSKRGQDARATAQGLRELGTDLAILGERLARVRAELDAE